MSTRIIHKKFRPIGIVAFSLLLGMLITAGLGSCKKYLDANPNPSKVLPSSLADCQALLDNFVTVHLSTVSTEAIADNYYYNYASWQTLQTDARNQYTWDPQANSDANVWANGYQTVLYANQALATLSKIDPATDPMTWNFVKGQALFYRAYTFFKIAQLWAKPYGSSAATDLGIPIRLTPDITEVTKRGTVQQTYTQIIQDLTTALSLLPANQPTSVLDKNRPCKASAYAALARVYLSMGDYVNAGINADNSLKIYGTLMDYNTISAPFAKFNAEILYEDLLITSLYPPAAKVDSNLYASYASNDLRKTLFFTENTGPDAGTYQFSGSYEGSPYSSFGGLATDEMYLTRAECFARAGDAVSAMADLNTLVSKRYAPGYVATAASADDALSQILAERRKELLFRGLRWTDLRRLNKDPRFAITLSRVLNGVTHTLPPNDLRYVLLIPQGVEKLVSLPQNPR